MSEPTDIQTIFHRGKPAFAVVPYATYLRLLESAPRVPGGEAVPHDVVRLHVADGLSLRRAWREYLGLTQAEVARRMGITQPALSQLESPSARPRRATLARLAKALGVRVGQLR